MNKTFLVLFLSLSYLLTVAQNVEWQKCENCRHSQIYYQILPSNKDFCIRSEFSIDAGHEQVLNAVIDFEKYVKWIYNCKTVELCEKDETRIIYRQIIAVPWPYKDSEVFMELKVSESENSFIITQNCIPNYKPLNSKFERITRYKSVWKISKTAGTKTHIAWYAETGGPKDMSQSEKWLFLCYAPSKTISELIEYVGEK